MTSSAPTMRALAVSSWGSPPALSSVPKPSSPSESQATIRMLASGLPQIVRSQAAGTHYSMQGVSLPYVPGIDGVGFTPDNKLVYLNLLANQPQGGGFADFVNADKRGITPVPVPNDASEAQTRAMGVKIASLMNPALSSWMALKHRAHVTEFTSTSTAFSVFIMGVTSTSGKIAAIFARHLGAKYVIGAARNASALEGMKAAGILDQTITLDKDDVTKTDFSSLSNPDNLTNGTYPLVVLDYIWGPAALTLLNALPKSANQAENIEIRYVHIGSLGRKLEIAVDGALLRSKNVVLSGSGPGSWSVKALVRDTPELVKAIVEAIPEEGWKEEYGIVERSLEDGETAWADKDARTVFVMG